MNVLRNSTRGLPSLQKWLLYYSYIITITTYGFWLQFFIRAPAKAQILLLTAMQYKTAFWFLGVFYTSPTGGIKALSGLILIHLHLKKLAKQSCLKTTILPSQDILIFLLSARNSKGTSPYSRSLALLSNIQYACLKGSLLDTEVSLLNLTEYFNLFDTKVIPGCRLLDSFPDHISFHLYNCSSLNNCIVYLESLDYFCLEVFSFSSTLIIVTDPSAISPKNMQVISAAHFQKPGHQASSLKTPASRTTAFDAELFVIRLGVSKTTSMNIKHIILVNDTLGLARRAVDLLVHSGQSHSLFVCFTLRLFFSGGSSHRIEF